MVTYPWQRVWVSTGTTRNHDYYGFPFYQLNDGPYTTKNAFKIEELEDKQCLILMGEPGSGKSTVINEYKPTNPESLFALQPLNIHSNSDNIIKAIETSEAFKHWEEVNYQKDFFLILDSLDEALLHVPVLYGAIREWLKSVKQKSGEHYKNFNLRITCRTAVWDSSFTEELKAIFNPKGSDENNVFQFELALLSQAQAREAAKINELDEDLFIERLTSLQLAAMAIKPITLQFLLQSFKEGQLNQKSVLKSDIYQTGCERLCIETNKERKRSGKTGKLDPKKRLLIASRLAAYTTFSNKAGIAKDWDHTTTEALSPSSFITDSFQINVDDHSIDDSAFREVLEVTSLFSATSNGLLTWSHKTYEEFLAAWHIYLLHLPITQLKQLFLSTEYSPYQLVPQLEETAIWLCSMNPEFLELIIQTQPKLILRIEDHLLDDEKKRIIVDALLNLTDKKEIADEWQDKTFYPKLFHSQIDSQLKPYLEDKTKNYVVRRLTTRIIEACKVYGLEEELWKVIEDKTETIGLRTYAVEALAITKDDNWIKKLVHLGLEPQEEDIYDDLKGTILKIIYPRVVSVTTVIEGLTEFKKRSKGHAYRSFIDQLAEQIPDHDLEIALNAFLSNNVIQTNINNHNHDFELFIDNLLNKAWSQSYIDGIAHLLAKFLIKLLSLYRKVSVISDDSIRRKVTYEVIKLIDEKLIFRLTRIHDSNPLIILSDWDWLIEILQIEKESAVRSKISLLIRSILPINTLSQQYVETIFSLADQFTEFKESFKGYLEPIDLESEDIKETIKYYQDSEKYEKQRVKREKRESKFSPFEQINKELKSVQKQDADLKSWYQLMYYVSLIKKDGEYYENHFELNIAKLGVWHELSEELQKDIIKEAYRIFDSTKNKRYSISDFRNGKIFYSTIHECKALHLILTYNPGFINNLPFDFYDHWGSMILWSYLDRSSEASETDLLLANAYHEKNYGQFQIQLKLLLEQMNNDHGLIYTELQKLSLLSSKFFDKNTAQILIDILNDDKNRIDNKHSILKYMVKEQFNYIKDYILEKVGDLSVPKDEPDILNVICGGLMIAHGDLFGWDSILKLIKSDIGLGEKLFLSTAYHIRGREIPSMFNGSMILPQLGELLIWLYQVFPTDEDPIHDGAYSPSDRDHIADIRNSCLTYLIQYGSIESINVLSNVIESLPNEIYLPWRLIDAKENMRKNTWKPEHPSILKKVLQNKDKRFVNNGNDLLEIVCQSLDRLQKKLQGETPAAQFLWNTNIQPTHKDENQLSDYVKNHLEEDLHNRGIIAQREVEIKRGTGLGDGERTDIYVSAFVPYTQDIVQVVIETKGCWHRELENAMEKQLRDDYLNHYKAQHGLYLVGWFYGNHFPIPQSSTLRSIEAMRLHFEQQALTLSNSMATLRSFILDCSI
ncbi:NACHT domain-containing protein [Xanthocytophaga flava]|uniref:NACHT domain-containing protein n=1 Tax=Xanthocytophaga flava TaxID=3048013 RepID=UPI0028D85D54|nr:hypothetical protein [Xanthocytophaga flavus]MDJ1466949.1 hypothetical protein [Xanthocytophaga flavus]